MSKLEEAKEILSSLKVPAKQQNGMCCCVLFAMANLTEEETWGSAANIGFGFTMSLRLQTAITEQPMQRIAVKPSANKPYLNLPERINSTIPASVIRFIIPVKVAELMSIISASRACCILGFL